MNEQEVTVRVLYDWDRITPNDISNVIEALPGVQGVSLTTSVTDVVSAWPRWRVQDNVSGWIESQPYDQQATAINICRGLNTPDAGGRYGVYVNEGDGWRRDLE